MVSAHPVSGTGRPSWLARQFFKLPAQLYRLGLGDRIGRSFLTLTATGRRTGRRRTVALNYIEEDGRIYVFSGFGPGSDWYRNVLVQPRVSVRIGARRLSGTARPIEDVAERRRLLEALRRHAMTSGAHGPPRPIRWLMKRLGILDYDASLRQAATRAEHIPAAEITVETGT